MVQAQILHVGKFKVVALLDGYVDLHLQNIVKNDSNFDHPYLHEKNPEATIQIPVNVYLIDTGARVILVDVGLAGHYHSNTGLLQKSLSLADYKPEQITDILITHLHPDHVAGLLTTDGKKAFVNAKLHIAKGDVAHWVYEQKIYPELSPMIAQWIAPYELHTFEPNQKLFEGVTVLSTPGHSPGHSSFLFESESKKLLVWGDIVHVHELQFACPGLSLKDDSDQQQAIATRTALFEYVSNESILIGGAHLPFPGLGHVKVLMDDSVKEDQIYYYWDSKAVI